MSKIVPIILCFLISSAIEASKKDENTYGYWQRTTLAPIFIGQRLDLWSFCHYSWGVLVLDPTSAQYLWTDEVTGDDESPIPATGEPTWTQYFYFLSNTEPWYDFESSTWGTKSWEQVTYSYVMYYGAEGQGIYLNYEDCYESWIEYQALTDDHPIQLPGLGVYENWEYIEQQGEPPIVEEQRFSKKQIAHVFREEITRAGDPGPPPEPPFF